MEEHSQKFSILEKAFKQIQSQTTCNLDKHALIFYGELLNVIIEWEMARTQVLTNSELITVQSWINRITGNRNISKNIRIDILNKSLQFNEMVEDIRRLVKNKTMLSK